jgi:hypothetical protein
MLRKADRHGPTSVLNKARWEPGKDAISLLIYFADSDSALQVFGLTANMNRPILEYENG